MTCKLDDDGADTGTVIAGFPFSGINLTDTADVVCVRPLPDIVSDVNGVATIVLNVKS